MNKLSFFFFSGEIVDIKRILGASIIVVRTLKSPNFFYSPCLKIIGTFIYYELIVFIFFRNKVSCTVIIDN